MHLASGSLDRRKTVLVFLALAAIGLAALLFRGRPSRPVEPQELTVAFIGRQQMPDPARDSEDQAIRKDHDQFHFAALEHHLAGLRSVDPPVNLTLKYFFNDERPRESVNHYRDLAADDSVVLVIDNTWGREFQAAEEAIRDGGLPVISLNADKGNKDFNQQVVFLGADDHTPRDLANYFDVALGADKAVFITEAEEEYDLTRVFEEKFAGRIAHPLEPLDEDEPNREQLEAVIAELSAYYEENEEARSYPLVLNTHAGWGSPLLNRLDEPADEKSPDKKVFRDLTILGGHYNVNESFRAGFGRDSGNRFISILEMTTDTVSEKVHEDMRRLEPRFAKYQERRSAELFLNRVHGAVAIVAQAIQEQERKRLERHLEDVEEAEDNNLPPPEEPAAQAPSRATFLGYFRELAGKCFEAEHDIMEFDEDLVARAEVVFLEYGDGEATAATRQLDADGKEIPSLKMGFQVTNVFDVDLRSGDFGADFFYWTKSAPEYADLGQRVIFKNLRQGFSEQPVTREGEDLVYRLNRLSGRFNASFDLADYPIDSQHLRVEVEVIEPSSRVRLSFDQDSLRETEIGSNVRKIDEWDLEDFYVTVENKVSESLYGRKFLRQCGQTTKNVTAHVILRRNATGPLLTIVIPLMLIGLVSLGVLYVEDLSFESVGHAAVGIFLGIVAFLIALSDVAPDMSQVSKAGELFWATFLVVVLVILVLVVVNSRLAGEAVRRRIVTLSRVGLPALYLIALVVIRYR